MNKIVKLLTAVVLVAAIGTLSACKKNFDQPPGAGDPNIVANTAIANLKGLHTFPGAYDVISDDLIITGIVVANDKSGNLYKQLFIQDSTGGLQVLLDANSLYGTYPVGRRIFIRCKGLCISDYNGTMELGVKATVAGSPSVEGIPANVIGNYVIGGSINNPVVPIPVTLSQLGTNMQDRYLGSLIQLDGYEFTQQGVPFSDTSVYKSTVNRDIKDCNALTTIIRTSAYANFASNIVPSGNGSIVAIYTTFGTTKQLLIRDTTDVKFNGERCAVFEESFSGIGANNTTLTLPGWKNIAEVGTVLYQAAIFGSVKCAKISAFGTGASVASSWLITPAIDLTGLATPKLAFSTAGGYNVGATTFNVYISTDYDGGSTPSTATWTLLPAAIAVAPPSGFGPFITSGDLDLSAYIGQTIYVGFKYDGGDPTKTTTYELDDVRILR